MTTETPVQTPPVPRPTPVLPPFQPWQWPGGLTAAYASQAGRDHERNEDSCSHIPSAERPGFCGVADGVGGGAHGDIASRVLLAHCARAPKEAYSDPDRLIEWLTRADSQVRAAVARRTRKAGAATLAAAWFPSQRTAYLLNVGDCRVYQLKPRRQGYGIRQLTVDQTYASFSQEPPLDGRPDDPARMVGAGAVGIPPVVRTRMRSRALLLLCSDGVHRFVSDDEMAGIVSNGLRSGDSLRTICSRLVHAARRNGSRDDASALLVMRHQWFRPRWMYAFLLAVILLLCFWLGTAVAETRSVIDPVEAPAPKKPPAPAAVEPQQQDPAVKRERRRAEAEQRKRASAEARAQAAESEAAELRAAEEARRANAAAAEAAARVAARNAAAAEAATKVAAQNAAAAEAATKAAARKAAEARAARAAAAKVAKAKAAEAARKEAQRQAAREAAARKVAAREAVAREIKEVAAREHAAREAAAREATAREAAREIAAREAAAREAAARELAAREAAARAAAAREAAAREVAAREAAAREAAAREAAAREVAAREAAAREAAVREAAAREAAAREAAAREAARELTARVVAGWETLVAGSRAMNGSPELKVFRDCVECPQVVWLPRGELPPGESSATGSPRYGLKISYVLAVGRFKVSNAEWAACVADRGCRRRPDGSVWGRGRDPVTNVSWEDAQQYAAWLSRRTSKPYRLLTGAEWEYAARAASEVYDMHGGVSEWVENCYQYRDPRGGKSGWTLECTNQTLRGGTPPHAAGRSGVARSFTPYHADDRIGFRVARTE